MRHYMALTLLVGAFAVALMALFGDDSYGRLRSLTSSIKTQQDINLGLEDKVSRLQSEIEALRFDDQELERKARGDLGLARPNELIFRFDTTVESEAKEMENLNKAKAFDSKVAQKDNASALRRKTDEK